MNLKRPPQDGYDRLGYLPLDNRGVGQSGDAIVNPRPKCVRCPRNSTNFYRRDRR